MSLIYTAPSAAGSGTKVRQHGLYIGGKRDARSRSSLDRWGITHILNVTPEKDSSIQVSNLLVVLWEVAERNHSCIRIFPNPQQRPNLFWLVSFNLLSGEFAFELF